MSKRSEYVRPAFVGEIYSRRDVINRDLFWMYGGRRWYIAFATVALGGGLFLAAVAGFRMEGDIPTPTKASVIHHQAPTPLPSEIYDGD
jgi:hypothetical protein